MNRIGTSPVIQSSYSKGTYNSYKTSGKSAMSHENATSGMAAVSRTAKATVQESAPQRHTDTIFLSEGKDPQALDSLISDLFDVLSREYPDITILGQKPGGTEDVRKIAAELGNGSFLIVSDKFIERMKQSQEDFETCKSVLKKALRFLSSASPSDRKKMISQGVYLKEDTSLSWSVSKNAVQNNPNKPSAHNSTGQTGFPDRLFQKTKPKNSILKVTFSNFSTSGQYADMAKAGSKSQVRAVMSDIHKTINSLQAVAAAGDDKQRLKARRAIRSLNKLLARGGRKIRRFNEEEITSLRKKRAEEAQKRKRIQQLKLELKKQRSARSGADSSLLKEGIHDTDYTVYSGKHSRYQEELERELAALDAAPDRGDVPAMDIGWGMAGGMGFSEADVSVTSEESF